MKDIHGLGLYANWLLRAFITVITAIVCSGLIARNVTFGGWYLPNTSPL
jgi:hypothetical protein